MSSLVSVSWLEKHLNDKDLIILDATISKVTSKVAENTLEVIPNAQLFDIKHKFSDTQAEFPNTIPTEKHFETEARALGINEFSKIVVYDRLGIYSSPRAWWLFKTFGFDNVFVLNGGLPEWKRLGYKTVSNYSEIKSQGNFKAKYQPKHVVFFNDLQNYINKETSTIIDARSSARFNCEVPEPREGLRSGSIPNSVNLPFQEVLKDGLFQPKEKLESTFKTLTKHKDLVFSCGSGITASILYLAAYEAGYKNLKLYDGSWTEYGTLTKK